MTINRVCPTCGMLTPVGVIVNQLEAANGYGADDVLCSGCGCIIVYNGRHHGTYVYIVCHYEK